MGDSFSVGGTGSYAELRTICINTGVASGQVVVFGSNPSQSDSKLAVIAAANTTTPSYVDFSSTLCQNGFQVYVLGANVDCTVNYA